MLEVLQEIGGYDVAVELVQEVIDVQLAVQTDVDLSAGAAIGDVFGGDQRAVADCVLNDLYWEAAALGLELKGARVTAAGGFDTATWSPRASAIRLRSAPMPPPARSRTCSM